MKWTHEEKLKEILSDRDGKGNLKRRESSTVEYKENFNLASRDVYTKAMQSFANNKGGYIIFGVQDLPHIPKGVNKENFDAIQQEKITEYLTEHFEPEIKWALGTVSVKGRTFGFIYTYEADEKPVICKKDTGKINSGEIYYRYRGQNRKIQFAELRRILDGQREKERDYWARHIERIAKIGPQKVAFIDLISGDIDISREGHKLIMDSRLLDQLKEKVTFIEEGRFVETGGTPTLKVVGEIQATDEVIAPDLDPNRDYPYLQKDIKEELGLNQHQVRALIWKYGLKGNRRYHLEVKTSKSGMVHKYSRLALERLKSELKKEASDPGFLPTISREYQGSMQQKK